MTAPAKPARTWTVYEQVQVTDERHLDGGFPVGTILLVQLDDKVVARTGSDACWKIAETSLLDRARGSDPPLLCASRNGTAQGLTEPRPYALKATVERVK